MEETKPQIIPQDPLSLKMEDEELVKILKLRVKTSEDQFNKKDGKNLKERVERNKKYYFGRQVDVDKLKGYEAKWLDNVIWESAKSIKAMSLSKLPDLIVTPGQEADESIKTAEELSQVIDTDIKRRERRRVLAQAFEHRPVYLRGVVKYWWNPEIGENGDYEFGAINPDDIVVDHTSKSNDQKDMQFIDEKLHLSLKELIMRFPDKKEEIIEQAKLDGVNADEDGEVPESKLATEVEVHETWFDWYEANEGNKYEKISCVAWRYHEAILKKMKNPNWDWQGEKRLFSYDQELDEEELRDTMIPGMEGMMGGEMGMPELPGMQTQTYYNNYFDSPEKPYIFLNADLWGDSPLDETTWVEQLVLMQYTLDGRGKTIAEKLMQRIKHIWSKEGGLKAEDIEEMDMNNPDEDVLMDGDISKFHAEIRPEMPSSQEMRDYDDTRNRMFAKAGTFATRGEVQSDTATSNQIAREADFTRADDLVEETINYAAEKMARAVLQMIKLRYTQDHYVKILGDSGKFVFQRVHRDMIEDGMEVMVTASGVDKIKAERRAMDMAQLQLIDPLTFYKDIGASDPVGRTKKLMTFMTSPEQYMAEFVMGLKGSKQQADALNGQTGGQEALLAIEQLTQGQMPQPPQAPDAEYIETFNTFMQSPEFMQLPPEIQQMISEFAQQLVNMVETQQPPSQQFGQPRGAMNPSPQDTSNVPTQAPMLAQGSTRNL
jgi:hypothetical protein